MLVHDLRIPLTTIKLSAELLQKQKSTDDLVIKYTNQIQKSVNYMSKQIDDVLGFVKTTDLNIKARNISDIVESAINLIEKPKNITILSEVKNVQMECDSVMMEKLLINLIKNAFEALEGTGGKITIRAFERDSNIIIEVTDSGPGIPENLLDKVFEPLFTTKKFGTGLGLATCKSIVEQHGGAIKVSNNPTTFSITFPKTISKLS